MDRKLTRAYDGFGRSGGFSLYPTGETNPAYQVTYGYETNTGRFQSVTSDIGGTQKTTTYSYLGNSDLVQVVGTGSDLTNDVVATYGYEPGRNLRTSVRNEVSNGQVVSRYSLRVRLIH